MRTNNRVKGQRFELALDAKGVTGLVLAALVLLGAAFVLGANAGRKAGEARAAVAPPQLEHLDAGLTARDEPAPELEAPRALADPRPIEKALPVAATPPQAQPDLVLAKAAPPSPSPSPTTAATSTPTATASAPPAAKTTAPARPAKVAARAVPPAAAKRYTIQLGSSASRADAERLARKVAPEKARVVAADVPKLGRRYRVQVGSYTSEDAARRHLGALTARAGVKGLVVAQR
jgi:septal ring-binding cell division protein DamX